MSYGRGAGREMVERIAARTKRATRRPLIFKSCALKSYDPSTGMVVVTDYSGETPQDIGPMQYFHPWAGDGYGDEVGLEKGTHIGVLCIDEEGHDYIALGSTFDGEHATLGVKTGEKFTVHKSGSYTKLTNDASAEGDGKGAHRTNGAALHEATTTGGHSQVMDDTAKCIRTTSAGGLQHLLDDSTNQIQHIAGPVKTIYDGNGDVLTHIATKIGLGDFPANLPASAAVMANAHFVTFEGNLFSQRLADYVKVVSTLNSVGALTNGTAALAAIEALALDHIDVPAGSAVTFTK